MLKMDTENLIISESQISHLYLKTYTGNISQVICEKNVGEVWSCQVN